MNLNSLFTSVSLPDKIYLALKKKFILKLPGMPMARKRTCSKEIKQVSKPDLVMTLILELSERKFKMTIINMLRTLMEKVDNI